METSLVDRHDDENHENNDENDDDEDESTVLLLQTYAHCIGLTTLAYPVSPSASAVTTFKVAATLRLPVQVPNSATIAACCNQPRGGTPQ